MVIKAVVGQGNLGKGRRVRGGEGKGGVEDQRCWRGLTQAGDE